MNHKKSKCIFFREGSVFNENCTKTISHCFCEIDAMEEDKPCTSDACRYYVRKRKKEGAGE